MRAARLTVVDEEIGVGAFRQSILARIRMRRALRHLSLSRYVHTVYISHSRRLETREHKILVAGKNEFK